MQAKADELTRNIPTNFQRPPKITKEPEISTISEQQARSEPENKSDHFEILTNTQKLLEKFFTNFQQEENKKLNTLNSNIENKLTAVIETNKQLNEKVSELEKKIDTGFSSPKKQFPTNLLSEISPNKLLANQNQSIGEIKPPIDFEISSDSAFFNSDIVNKGNTSIIQSGQKLQKLVKQPKKVEEPLKIDTPRETESKKNNRLEPVNQKASFEIPIEKSKEEEIKQEKLKDNILKKFVEKFAKQEKSIIF